MRGIIKPVMRMLRRSKTWILLSLLALLGVVVTPAMAFKCCCSSLPGSAPHQGSEPKAQVAAPKTAPPSCHAAKPVVPAKTEQCHSPKSSESKPDGVSFSSIEPVCDCPPMETLPATSTDTVSVFASLGLPADLPVALSNLTAHATSAVRFSTGGAEWPSRLALSPHAGRAPPAI